jgi:transcriptional regulator with XRE-family HTH domain
MNEPVASNLKRLRGTSGWSQERLAEAAGLSGRTVQRAERSGELTERVRRALARALNVTAADLAPPNNGTSH